MVPAAIGFTVKSGWAAAVVVRETDDGIRILDSRRVDLCDPALPESKQPYHDGFATMRRSGPQLTKLLASVRRFGVRSVGDALAAARGHGQPLAGAGVVVGSLIDPSTIGNEHIRIHAMEGRLFREVVIAAAADCGIESAVWRERDLMSMAVKALKCSDATLRRCLVECGRAVTGPWRAEQKSAALAAWLVVRGVR
jgi:hypothetical protein